MGGEGSANICAAAPCLILTRCTSELIIKRTSSVLLRVIDY